MTTTNPSRYQSQQARDAERIGYGDETYWEHLDQGALEHRAYFLRKGETARAEEMLTRSLSEALAGNDGD